MPKYKITIDVIYPDKPSGEFITELNCSNIADAKHLARRALAEKEGHRDYTILDVEAVIIDGVEPTLKKIIYTE